MDSAEEFETRLLVDDRSMTLHLKYINTELERLHGNLASDAPAVLAKWCAKSIRDYFDSVAQIWERRKLMEQRLLASLRQHEELGTTETRIQRAVDLAFRSHEAGGVNKNS